MLASCSIFRRMGLHIVCNGIAWSSTNDMPAHRADVPLQGHAKGPTQESPYVYPGTHSLQGHPFQMPALMRVAATARVAKNVAEPKPDCRLNSRKASCQGISGSPTLGRCLM